METGRFKLSLAGKWLYHRGEFEYRKRLTLGEVQALCKSGGILTGYEAFEDEKSWREVELPHDALIEEGFDEESDSSGGYRKRITCWYKRSFVFSETEYESVTLVFDGVLGKCEVYVNGVLAVRNFSGYNRFSCEIGDYIHAGENSIAVYVDGRQPAGWWYEGIGIYRDVFLEVKGRSYIEREDSFVRSRYSEGRWYVDADIAVKAPEGKRLSAHLYDRLSHTVAAFEGNTEKSMSLSLQVAEAEPWSPESPVLYTLEIRLYDGDACIDDYTARVGMRHIEWSSASGMLLNGTPYTVKGLCSHQDHVGVGAAVTYEIEEYRIRRMKSLGANAYRCVHHAPSESLLEICDRLGMLVMVENRHFSVSDDTLRQLDSLVRLSRSHSSVFLYCLFNEEPWQAEEKGYKIAKKLRERVLALDGTRAVLGAQNFGHIEEKNAVHALDIVGANYSIKDFEKIHEAFPEKVILGTENCPTYATRGVTVTDKEREVFADNGEHYPAAFSESLPETVDALSRLPYFAGCFVFCGLDYLGEPHPFEGKSVASHWGMLDSCGFNKNISYWLMSAYKKEPVLKLCVFPEGENSRVIAFTNAERVELFSAGRSYGIKVTEHNKAEWILPNAAEYSANAVINGELVTDRYKKPGGFHSLTIEDETPLSHNPSVRILNLSAVDREGNAVVDSFDEVVVRLSKGNIRGVGNGDPAACFPSQPPRLPLFFGKAQIIVSADAVGEIECNGVVYTI